MRVEVVKGSLVATLAALVWSTYYIFVTLVKALDPLSLFFYPSLFGGLLFALYGLYRKRKIPLPSRKRDYFIPGVGYFISQMLIILSTVANGGVLTSTFILLGDTIVSPSVIFLLGRNRYMPRVSLLFLGLIILVAAASLLTLYGGYVSSSSAYGILLLLLVPPTLSLFFIYTNQRIMVEGMEEILTPAFLVSCLFVLVYAIADRSFRPVEFVGLSQLAILAVIGVSTMFVGYVLFFRASAVAGFTLSSILMALIPPFTLILSVAFLATHASLLAVTMIVCAAIGAILCTLAFAEEAAVRTKS